MNIINGIARAGSPHVLVPASLAPEEGMLWERSTCNSGMCWMHINVYLRLVSCPDHTFNEENSLVNQVEFPGL